MVPELTNAYLESKIAETDKPIAFVLKGFPKDKLEKLENKLFSNPVYEKLPELLSAEKVMSSALIEKSTSHTPYFWVTYEEFKVVERLIQMFYETVNITNNLYYNLFPYQDTLHDVFSAYEQLYYNDDSELSDEESSEIDAISRFYGNIYKNEDSGTYYVTYQPPENEFSDVILFYGSELREKVGVESATTQTDEELYQFELGDNEDCFLIFIEKFIKADLPERVEILFVGDKDNLPNKYLERLEIINYLLSDKTDLVLSTKKLNSRKIEREKEYKNYLTDYWGYESFKDLKMYKDISLLGNQTIDVSQVQIVNDIVQQSEAAFRGDSYRDVYVTSATGSGKSVMFQIPALYLAEKFKDEGFLTIVISPLIGLMDDQVKSMEKKNICNAKTIHSNLSQTEREDIITGVQNGSVDILYISTETLQSRADLSMLIGQRRLGLLIVDEAHIVTTWGKSFRADYWYMGAYLAKVRKKQAFPIVTFTATAIFGGKEDMYLETRDSLNMVNPIAYFGYVKRDDIKMAVTPSQKSSEKYSNEYIKTKFEIMTKRLEQFAKLKQKTLIYFPTVRLLNMFHSHIKQNSPSLFEYTARYYGSLEKHEKKETYQSFLDGRSQIMLATKAFGMGIDIPDITNVYHYAPTGNVIDYIQEIGRAARDLDTGYAWFDFMDRDFTEVKKLHGLSTIRKNELIEVMRKIVSLYEQKKNRNLVVSADDFEYIFKQNNHHEIDIDNRIKLTLLMIEKDFNLPEKLGYPPFVARPRQVFGNEIVFLTKEGKKKLTNSRLKPFFKEEIQLDNDYYDSVQVVDFKSIWEKFYPQLSFPNFKRCVYTSDIDKLKDKPLLKELYQAAKINVEYLNDSARSVESELDRMFELTEEFLREKVTKQAYFTEEDLASYLRGKSVTQDKFFALSISSVLINSMMQINKIKSSKFIKSHQSNNDLYQVTTNYMTFFNIMKGTMQKLFHEKKFKNTTDRGFNYYALRNKANEETELEKVLLGIGETIGTLNYEIQGGNNPQIYIRINSAYQLEKVIKSPGRYQNNLLNNVYFRHNISVELLTYLFKMEQTGQTRREEIDNYSKDFWDVIEDYFLGKLPDEVNAKLYK